MSDVGREFLQRLQPGAATVLVRQMLLEDVATKDLWGNPRICRKIPKLIAVFQRRRNMHLNMDLKVPSQ